MPEYKAAVLLPLTIQGTNPVGVPLLEFELDPQLKSGDMKTFEWVVGNKIIRFEALVTLCAVDSDTGNVHYMLEIRDRQLALDIAEILRKNDPCLFDKDNLPS